MKIIFIDYSPNIHAKKFFQFFSKVAHCELNFIQGLSESKISLLNTKINHFDIVIYADFFQLNSIGLKSKTKKICISWTSDIVKAKIENRSLPEDLFDFLIVDSDFAKRLWMRAGIPEFKIFKMPYGVSLNSNSLPDSRNRNQIISFRSWGEVYNQKTILKAVDIIKNETFYEIINFAGKGETLLELKSKYRHLVDEKKVNFLGPLSHRKILELLPTQRLYISASASDGVSVSMLEAMGVGTPVLVSNLEANNEWIIHGKNGFLFETFSPEDLALKICDILQNKYDLKKIAASAFQMIGERADWEENTRVLYRVLQSKLF